MRVAHVNVIDNIKRQQSKNTPFRNADSVRVAALSGNEQNSKRDEAILSYLERAEKREKQAPILSLAMMAITFPLCFLVMKKYMPGGKSKLKDAAEEGFKSLKDNIKIPTLDTCKSISDTLHNFLRRQVTLSKASTEDLQKMGMQVSAKNILLSGPAGTGKTQFSKIFAKSLDADYMEVTYARMNARFTGDHLERIKGIFKDIIDTASKNRDKKYVVTFNEIDAIIVPHQGLVEYGGGHLTFKKEERNLFLTFIDEISEKVPNVTVIGTTNSAAKKSSLDEAALSRFGSIFEVDYPDKKCLFEALKTNFAEIENGAFIVKYSKELEQLAERLSKRKASFRDIDNIVANSRENQLTNYVESKDTGFKYEFIQQAAEAYRVTDGEIAGVAAAA